MPNIRFLNRPDHPTFTPPPAVFLPRLQQADYHDMLSHILPSLPKGWRGRYKLLAHDGIPEATRLGQGPRFFEELLLEVAIRDHLAVGFGSSPE